MLSRGTVVAGRYELAECLGAGAMGEVWRARDTRFESRLVAVKFLKEDETLKEDALNRDRLVVRLDLQASRGLTPQFAVDAIASALSVGNIEALKAKAATAFGDSATIEPAAVTALFDELVNDPLFNDNARMRAKMRRLFHDEANTVANLRHDNIVSIFDYGHHDGLPFLVMDYIEGRTIYQMLQAQEKLDGLRRLQFMEDLCAGLGYAHRHKLVHRDIKPANLIIDNSTGSLKILDFGVVRRLGSKSTLGVPVGTFCYMSPEQTRGAATLDHRSDIFAVGVVFYELMSGRKAFPPGKSINDLVARIQREQPLPLSEVSPSVPPAIESIIYKAIEKEPDARYQDLSVMGREITRMRARIEAAEQSDRTLFAAAPRPAAAPPRPAQPGLSELLENAERAFAAGDDQRAIAICRQMVASRADFQPALSLMARSEARLSEHRLGDTLRQAESLMAHGEMTSAQATLDRAREINRSSSKVRVLQAKLDAAREAERERAERERAEQQRAEQQRLEQQRAEQERLERQRLENAKPPAPGAPRPFAPLGPLDNDAVTVPIRRPPSRQPSLPIAQASPERQPPAPPAPPARPAPPPADVHAETMLIRPIAAPPRFQQPQPKAAPVVPPPPAAPPPVAQKASRASRPAAPPAQSSSPPMMDLPLQSAPAAPPRASRPQVPAAQVPPQKSSTVRPPAPRQGPPAPPRTPTSPNARYMWLAALAAVLALTIYFATRLFFAP